MDDLVQLKTKTEQLGDIDRQIVQLCLEKNRLAAEYSERTSEIESKLNQLRSEKYEIMTSAQRTEEGGVKPWNG